MKKYFKFLVVIILFVALILEELGIAFANEVASTGGQNQVLQNENIDGALRSPDNAYIVELSGKFKQDINKEVKIKLCEDSQFRDNEAIVGKPLVIEGLKEKARLSFKFRSGISKIYDGDENGHYAYLLCRFANGRGELLNTVKSETTDNSIYAEISKAGTYYVLNVKLILEQYNHALNVQNQYAENFDFSANRPFIMRDIKDNSFAIFVNGPVPKLIEFNWSPENWALEDADKDGVTNYKEFGGLEIAETWDINSLVALVTGGKIASNKYGKINLYNYKSNPTLSDSDYDGITDVADSEPLNNVFSGKMVNNYMVEQINAGFNMIVDFREFFSNNQVYNKNLAVMSSVFASDVYDACYFVVEKGGRISSLNENDKLYKLFGMENVENIKLSPEDYTNDKDDISEFVICHKPVKYKDLSQEIVFLVIRGTNGSNAEWTSNFDIGADTTEYYQANGYTHKYWTNKENHKGFETAANRILEKVNDYLLRHGLHGENVEKSILITGHSRGGAIANLLGAHFENQEGFKPYTYTFACPNVTISKEICNYKTIFNIVNTDDIITYLNMKEWGFGKYGSTYEISVGNTYGPVDEGSTGAFEKAFGKKYTFDENISRTLELFADIVNTREELYVLDSSPAGFVNIGNRAHTSIEKAEERKKEVEEMLKKAKLLKYTKLAIKDGILGLKYVEVNYSPAYFMQNLANIASTTENPGPLVGYDTAGKYTLAKLSFAANNVNVFERTVTGVVHPHMPATYYFIVQNGDFSR